jgi:signal transduction histidine kinase
MGFAKGTQENIALDPTCLVGMDVRRRLLAIAVDAERLAAELPSSSRYLLRIVENARDADRELRALIDSASILRSDFELRLEPIDFGQLAEDVLDGSWLAGDRARLQTDLRYQGTVMADAPRLMHALETLLRGALDHAPRNAPIFVRLDGPPQRARFQVVASDLGEFTEEASRAFGGEPPRTGIGAALGTIRKVVEAHRGTLTLERADGRAAQIVLELGGTATRGMLARR